MRSLLHQPTTVNRLFGTAPSGYVRLELAAEIDDLLVRHGFGNDSHGNAMLPKSRPFDNAVFYMFQRPTYVERNELVVRESALGRLAVGFGGSSLMRVRFTH